MENQTREAWLVSAAVKLRADFLLHGYKVPEVRISVGLPAGGKRKLHTTIGQHWAPSTSVDSIGAIFISPMIDDAVVVLSTLVHEMVHAAVGNDKGHGIVFKRCATKLGLVGKMRATSASSELKERLNALISEIGPYPHARMKLGTGPDKRQSTRMIKMECAPCEYIARASRKCIDLFGAAICPGCGEQMKIERRDDE